ncbi:MAG: hydroxyacylglutathione hydrolase [Hyphomicrobiaceae bacterium]|nr:hydroxyacylglutathione hydrolase [Hyphomicrobiaceae bacterium]
MPTLDVHQATALSDNYSVVVHDPATKATACIDAPDAAVVAKTCADRGWTLTHILVTHHHWDHTGGIADLKRQYGATVVGPAAESHKIAGLDRLVRQGDTIDVGTARFDVMETPGHTLGHISFVERANGLAFVGDTLFAMGCGRVIEGDYAMMWGSLQKIMALPGDTMIFCGHDYDAANAQFAVSIEPGNAALQLRAKQAAAGVKGVPMRLADELATNPFLRADSAAVRAAVGIPSGPAWKVFGEIRDRKNRS